MPLIAMLAIKVAAAPPVDRIVIYSGSSPYRTVDQLAAASDAVVVLHSTGHADVHWNSSDGRAWSSDDRTHPAYIYSDEDVVVDRVLRGSMEPGKLSLRKLGGTADGVRMVFDDDPHLATDTEYLVFLTNYPTPTESGSEARWTIQWMSLGVFTHVDGKTWVNEPARLVTNESQVSATD